MHRLRRFSIGIAAAVIALAGATVSPAQAAEPDVYTVPGGHIQADRLWNTTCAKYSTTVVRCTTNIWATQIVRRGGSYVADTGWHFNNLTYLPSARAAWAGNPLAQHGTFTSDGRQWRTECDTPATGRGACRSYIWTNFIAKEGTRYVTKNGWVFNNIVRFAQGGVAPVMTIPAHVIDQSRLTPSGLGPLQLHVPMLSLQRLNYVAAAQGECAHHPHNPVLTNRGIQLTELSPDGVRVELGSVLVDEPYVKTTKGAHVGMTIAQVRALHGAELQIVEKTALYGQHTVHFATIREGDNELIFYVSERNEASLRYPSDTQVVQSIQALPFWDEWGWDGC